MTCYLCSSQDTELVSEKLRYESKCQVFRCNNCGLVFLSPRMTPEEEKAFYENEYGEIYSSEKGTTISDLFENRQADAQVYYDLISDHISKEDTCLEIGCSSGYFLDRIRSDVKSIVGIEIHEELKNHCEQLGIEMIESLADCEDGRFDKIFMFFVLEHVGDPINFLREVRRVLAPKGRAFIEVPNIDDVLVKVYDIPAFRDFYYTPAHPFYFSKNTLHRVLSKAEFGQINIKPLQRYDLSNHVFWMMKGRPGGQGVYDDLFNPELLEAYGDNLTSKFLCDTLFAEVEK